ncbi:hypothetical protein SAMN06295909_0114 [Plantibacter sp. VKM Ac-1784]|uniref:FMN-binding domain-containing protein n=1 Tax=Plantibacter elymi (nom. nud.) TaxID=199708 RepID=A0ABY1R747_9MICO|nr:hypothetical protein [Plantibacter sp. VKM Ac-1784]SMQ58159.1 hypothetical protein SAMN06295909_0114 [Plantibacter sp. VKM Ac-1784]
MTITNALQSGRTVTTFVGGALVVVAVSGCAGEADPSPSRVAGPQQDSMQTPATPDYKDGDYTATGWYGSLPSHQDVTLSIAGDTVTAVTITTPAEDETSLGYQQRFTAALPAAIIGRELADLDVDRLAGASGCSEGFMDALAKVRADAIAD